MAASTSTARASLRVLSRHQPARTSLRSLAQYNSYATSSTSSNSIPTPTSSTSSAGASLANTLASAGASKSSSQEAAENAAAAAAAKNKPPPSSSKLDQPSESMRDSLIKGVAKVMGYNTRTATAIRTTSDYYDRCSERDEREATFFYDECGLPRSYQSWMQITNLHIWLLSVRFRALPAPLGKSYIQEIINHYFIHSETLMRTRYSVKQGRLIKGYLRDMLYQYHGANMGYDEGLVSENDAVLTAAVWRNIFGAGWGKMGGVKGKLNQDNVDKDALANGLTSEDKAENPLLNVNIDANLPPTPDPTMDIPNQAGGHHLGGSGMVPPLPPFTPPHFKEQGLDTIESKEARFALNLERLVVWIRKEVNRMEKLSDEAVMNGAGVVGNAGGSSKGALTDFSRI